jgi:hypothetical protein
MRKTHFNHKFDYIGTQMQTSHRKSLHYVAAQIVVPKSSGQRATKLLKLCLYKIQAKKIIFFRLQSKRLVLQMLSRIGSLRIS